MKWNQFIEELQDNVDGDEMGNKQVTLESILVYAGLLGIKDVEKYWELYRTGQKVTP